MFKKLFDELLVANSQDEITNVLYGLEGVDLSYQRCKLSAKDHERLFELAELLSERLKWIK